jgi:hypothetical protein
MPSAIQLEITRAIAKQIWWGNNERYPKGDDCCDSELATPFQQVSETICFSIILYPSYVIVLNWFLFRLIHLLTADCQRQRDSSPLFVTPTLISWQDGVGVHTKKQKRLPSNKCTVLRSYCATTTQVIYIPVPQPVYISLFHQIDHQLRPAFVSPHGGSFRGFGGASHFGFAGSHHFAPMQYGGYGTKGYSLQVGTNE